MDRKRKGKDGKPSRGRYVRKTIIVQNKAGEFRKVTKYISGRIGARDQKRMKEAPTEERIKKWQDKRAGDTLWGYLEENFNPGDCFFTPTYPPKSRKTSEEVRKDMADFRKRLRKIYQKAGIPFKYLMSVGRGKRGAIHSHWVLPRIDTELLEKAWQDVAGTKECPYPLCNVKHLDRSGEWSRLAAYLVKNGLETFRSSDPIYKRRYLMSQNLRKPRVKTEIVKAGFWKSMPRMPRGFSLLSGSLRSDWTGRGYPYQAYTVVRRKDMEKLNC